MEDASERDAYLEAAEADSGAGGLAADGGPAWEWDGDVLWHRDAAAAYGRRSSPLRVEAATEYAPLLSFAMRKLDSLRMPALELAVKAVDLSAAGGGDPVLPGKLVGVVDAAHGLGRADAPLMLPCTSVSQLDFADPESGRVELGAPSGTILGARRPQAQASSQPSGGGYALSRRAAREFADGVREVSNG